MKKMSLMVTSFLFFNLNGLSDGSQPFKDLTIGMKDVVCRDYKQTSYGLGFTGAGVAVSGLLSCFPLKNALIGASITYLAARCLFHDTENYSEGLKKGFYKAVHGALVGSSCLLLSNIPFDKENTNHSNMISSMAALFPLFTGASIIAEDTFNPTYHVERSTPCCLEKTTQKYYRWSKKYDTIRSEKINCGKCCLN